MTDSIEHPEGPLDSGADQEGIYGQQDGGADNEDHATPRLAQRVLLQRSPDDRGSRVEPPAGITSDGQTAGGYRVRLSAAGHR